MGTQTLTVGYYSSDRDMCGQSWFETMQLK